MNLSTHARGFYHQICTHLSTGLSISYTHAVKLLARSLHVILNFVVTFKSNSYASLQGASVQACRTTCIQCPPEIEVSVDAAWPAAHTHITAKSHEPSGGCEGAEPADRGLQRVLFWAQMVL